MNPPTEQLSLLAAADYVPLPGAWDEMWDPSSGVRRHWAHLAAGMARLSPQDWLERGHRISRLLRENGVTYHVYSDPRGYSRTWELDPVPLVLDGDEWQEIAAGLEQRAVLLDLILRDLYGPRTLLRRGLLPPELIFAHGGYLRPLIGALAADRRQLIFYAADLARGPDGQVWVMADRTQAPSGVGYALENRAAMARTFPDLMEGSGAAKLNYWLSAAQAALARLSAREQPHVVVLTPGPANETYFEHAYLAARHGYTLAQGDDLMVRDGHVWLKTVGGLKTVDVILRRVDEAWCDPLELRPESRLGSAGLLEALRRGSVAMANPPGSGVLENPGLLPFLPSLAKALLGEELKLPMAATWWCGQAKECEYVLANLDRLMLKPIHRGLGQGSVYGGHLDRRQKALWRERIRKQPHLYVGQQRLALSTAPAMSEQRLLPHQVTLRAFLTSHDEGYATLPGGLTRCKLGDQISGQVGALAKDTWVTPSPPKPHARLVLPTGISQEREILSSRAADNLFWCGRYIERAEGVARLLRVVLDGLWEEDLAPGLAPVQNALLRLLGLPATGGDASPDTAASLHARLTSEPGPRQLAATLDALLACAYSTREYWSVAIWRLLDRIEHDRRHLHHEPAGNLIDSLAGLAGLASETLPRESAFRFFDLGRRIERGLTACSVLSHLLELPLSQEAERESLSLILQSVDSLVGYRRRYRQEPHLAGVLELLVWDSDSPRSLLYQIHIARTHLDHLTPSGQHSQAERLLFSGEERLYRAEPLLAELENGGHAREELRLMQDEVARSLSAASDAISHTWFTHVQEFHALRVAPAPA